MQVPLKRAANPIKGSRVPGAKDSSERLIGFDPEKSRGGKIEGNLPKVL
jgi:hypothetical protein